MSQQASKTKGVVDIVFLLDVTGSMQPCIDALKANISTFIDTLTTRDANNSSPVDDWRGKAVGYRDVKADGNSWLVDNPFVRDADELKRQLSRLEAKGGGDEPESLLDALYTVGTMRDLEKGEQSEDPAKWRYLRDAARVVVVFTDASYHPTIDLPEAEGGVLSDITNIITSKRIILSIFAPEMPCYDDLCTIDKSEYEAIQLDGMSPQTALEKFTADQENFKVTLRQLAASVSASAVVPRL